MNAMSNSDASNGRQSLNSLKGEAIAIQGVSKRFGPIVGVDCVDLQVEAGEFLSLLGPSGSGKTTLLMMLAGFEMPSSGSITLGGRDLTHVSPNKRGIGMVFQRYALFPHMSVAQNVGFPLKMRGVSKAEIAALVDQALSRVRLQNYDGRMPAQLSGGQQQRVAVARALVFQPPVLLMDEPLGALDKKLREELQIEIKTLHASLGVTIGVLSDVRICCRHVVLRPDVTPIHRETSFGIDAHEDASADDLGRIVNHRPEFERGQCRLDFAETLIDLIGQLVGILIIGFKLGLLGVECVDGGLLLWGEIDRFALDFSQAPSVIEGEIHGH